MQPFRRLLGHGIRGWEWVRGQQDRRDGSGWLLTADGCLLRLGVTCANAIKGSRAVRGVARRGMLNESVRRTCENLPMAEEGCLKHAPCVKNEYATRINDVLCVE